MELVIGDKVIRNDRTWIVNEFDGWGRGVGIGVVVDIPFTTDSDIIVDVRWEHGRCYESINQIIKIDK
jgi:hypothetical protein